MVRSLAKENSGRQCCTTASFAGPVEAGVLPRTAVGDRLPYSWWYRLLSPEIGNPLATGLNLFFVAVVSPGHTFTGAACPILIEVQSRILAASRDGCRFSRQSLYQRYSQRPDVRGGIAGRQRLAGDLHGVFYRKNVRGLQIAVHQALSAISTDLEVRSACAAKFTPKLMSVDEAGSQYLIVESGGRTSRSVAGSRRRS